MFEQRWYCCLVLGGGIWCVGVGGWGLEGYAGVWFMVYGWWLVVGVAGC